MPSNATISDKINPDLLKERQRCSFDVEEFSRWWNGGEKKLQEKRDRENFFLNDPELDDDVPVSYLSHKEIYEHSVKKAISVFKKMRQLQAEGNDGVDNYMALLGGLLGSGVLKEGNPLTLHFVMFVPTILGQCTTDQQAEWLGRAWNLEILGTYAQTELGHGTFIRGLETTATYDEKTQEFVLNSPTLTAFKWWPGGCKYKQFNVGPRKEIMFPFLKPTVGQSTNYAVVVAQLYTKGQCHGIHPFFVQIRDEETWHPMPGIKVGEIGAKLGMKGLNNGYLGFDHVRIPRTNMLMRNNSVLEDGTYVKAPSSVLTYGTMMFVRVVVVKDMANYLSKAATIATRYSAVRRQSPIDPNQPEPQIIDHITQQNKLFPCISRSVMFKLAADYIWQLYNQVTGELDRGDLERLPELHALSCCLKAVCTADAATDVETLRMSCGGHGFMECSNFPTTYAFVTAASTYEGENTVLLLQTARYLLKSWSQAINGQPLVPTVAYLRDVMKFKAQRWQYSVENVITALQLVSANKVRISYDNVEKRKKQGHGQEDACNLTSIELAQSAVAHCRAFILQSSFETLKEISRDVSPALSKVLNQLLELYAINTCMRSVGDLLMFANLNANDIQDLQHRMENILADIRPNAVGIVDGFDIPDKVLCSALGAYDGNVYERLFAEAQKSPLNQEPVNKSFELYLKPFMRSNL